MRPPAPRYAAVKGDMLARLAVRLFEVADAGGAGFDAKQPMRKHPDEILSKPESRTSGALSDGRRVAG